MKNFLTLVVLAVLLASSAVAQKRVHPKDMQGTTWKMVLDLDKEADNAIERIALKAVDGFMDEIDIQFDFRKDGALRTRVSAFGEEDDDVEYSSWSINENGQLSLGETDSFDAEDTIFMRHGKRLLAYEYKRGRLERKESVYLVQVDR